MALKWLKVPISITAGIDTKTDEKNVPIGSWLAAENVDYRATGAVSKRQGFTAKTVQVDGGTDLHTGDAATTFLDELLQYSNNQLYTFSENKNRWYNKGAVSNAVTSETSVGNTTATSIQQDYATVANISCYAFTDVSANSNISIRLYDNDTQTLLAEHSVAGSGLILERVGYIANTFLIFYQVAGAINYYRIDVSDLLTLQGPVVVAATGGGVNLLNIGNRLFVSYADATNMNIFYYRDDLTSVAPVGSTLPGTEEYYCMSKQGFSDIRLVYGNTTVLYDYNLSQIHAPATGTIGFQPTNGGSVQDPDNADATLLFVNDNIDVVVQIGIKMFRIDSAGVFTDLGWVMHAVNMVSQPQLLNGQVYMVVNKKLNDSNSGQRTYYLISKDGQLLSKVADGVAVRRTTQALAPLLIDGPKLSFIGAQYSEFFKSDTPASSTSTAIMRYTFDFNTNANFYDATLGKSLHVSGGLLSLYDGKRVTENGFLEVPLPPYDLATASISPSLGVGSQVALEYPQTVQYVVVYAWVDDQGQIHRSAPSVGASIAIPDFQREVTMKVRPLTLTNKTNVEVEIYRTEGNGTTLYKVSAATPQASLQNGRLDNDPSEAFLTFTDRLSDDTLIGQELLYTTGGVLENVAPISNKYVVSNKTRVFLLSGDGQSIQYSKLAEENVGLGFFDGFIMRLDRVGGEATALAVMDDNLIILKRNTLQLLAGQGPDNLGQNDDFRQPTTIPSDVGCVDPSSVLSTPAGVAFKSSKGIYLLRRNFQVEYIGAPVERYNNETITSATLLQKDSQAVFTTESGTALMFDYDEGKWATYENLRAVDAVVYNNRYCYLRSNGSFMESGGWSDNGTYVPLVLESSWIPLDGIQGFQKVKSLYLLGQYFSPHKIKVSFAYDYINNYTASYTIDATAEWSGGEYGLGDYGDGEFGGNAKPLQKRVFTKTMKCQAIKFKIETLYDGALGPDSSFSNFLLEIGLKDMAYKAPSSGAAK